MTAANLHHADNCSVISSPHLSNGLSCDSFDFDKLKRIKRKETERPGRAPVALIQLGNNSAVLKHYYRGGMIAKLSNDYFVNTGIQSSRAVREYRLLEWMTQQELPVPEPLGARVLTYGLFYTCDLITRLVPDTMTLAAKLSQEELPATVWTDLGKNIRKFHEHRIWHSDLNATNILLCNNDHVTIIDFDRCRRRKKPGWEQGNLERLKRSLNKLTKLGSVKYFNSSAWQSLLIGYHGH